MEVKCASCKAKFKIADEKLPAGQLISLNCPKCKNKMAIDTRPAAPGASLQAIIDDVASDTYDAALKPFDFLHEGAKTALVCEQDETIIEKIRSTLERMDYNVTDAASTRDALKFMRFHTFDLVVLNESFDGSDPESNYVLKYVAQLPSNARRDVFVVLVGNSLATGDNLTAFNKSVNFVLNLENVDELEKFLTLSLGDHAEFYRMLKECMKKVGRA